MATATLPIADLSRARLRQVSHWIRDELDPLVAREGPELLRADDVLTLHDVFQALKTSSGVTALDLRATGIHRAVMEISGLATRWPGRLADDCDRLIDVWTTKFGRLGDLRPFLYGRGGRLEGIASSEETSKLALLKRWQDTCPDKISPIVARRRGSLGFNPGSWWINTLFACHAGIIDVDTIDGGICYDKHGAYAIVILDGGELDALSESTLTYRCGKDDRGKFHLTAATPRSREPLRVLQSHSASSMWGPKAGVRYEGLYRVTGWAIHQPRTSSSNARQKSRLGDMYYDICLERCDSVAIEEVGKSPTASELDDYSEFKRLRKIHRHLRNNTMAASNDASKILPVPAKIAPKILPPVPAPSGRSSLFRTSPAASRAPTFAAVPGGESLGTSKDFSGDVLTIAIEERTVSPTNLSIPAAMLSLARTDTSRSDPPPVHTPPGFRRTGSIASTSKSRPSFTEVAPWIDYDLPHLALPTTNDLALTTRSTTRTHLVPDQLIIPTSASRKATHKKTDDMHSEHLRYSDSKQDPESAKDLNQKQSRKSVLLRTHNPVAKLFDGTGDEANSTVNYSSSRRPSAVLSSLRRAFTAFERRAHASSSEDRPQPVTPTPLEPMSPVQYFREDQTQ